MYKIILHVHSSMVVIIRSLFLFLLFRMLLMRRCLIRLLTIKGNKIVLRLRKGVKEETVLREIGFKCKILKFESTFFFH